MNHALTTPEQLARHIDGGLVSINQAQIAPGAQLYACRLEATGEVSVPALRDVLVVAHLQPIAREHRMIDGRWRTEQMRRGDVSFFAREEPVRWKWDDDLRVVHLHLSQEHLLQISCDMLGRDVADLRIHNAVRLPDRVIHRLIVQMYEEGVHVQIGTELVTQSLLTQLAVRLLRRHADIAAGDRRTRGLSFSQQRLVQSHIETHLGDRLTLDDLAGTVFLSRYHFLRLFRESLHTTPHEYVMTRRVELAGRLLSTTTKSIKEVAELCGFADQSHLTRVYRRRTGVTPGQFRRSSH